MIDLESNLAAQWAYLEGRGIDLLCLDGPYVTCLGEGLHTTRSSPCDCKLFVNDVGLYRVMYLYCFHRSCSEILAGVNRDLYQIATGAKPQSIPAGGGEGVPRAHVTPMKPSTPFPGLLDTVLTNHPWSYADIANDQLGRVLEDPKFHYIHALWLFDGDEFVWNGRDVYDSGRSGHKWRFRTPGDWMDNPEKLGPYVCPNPFRPGSISRCEEAVSKRKFLVVESDVLSHDETGAVFRYLNENHFRLRAVVDTAGKSLHGWFDHPTIGDVRDHHDLLVSLKCDPSMLNPSQPCRLPGMLRDGMYQRLIYFDAEPGSVTHPTSSNPCNSPKQPIQ